MDCFVEWLIQWSKVECRKDIVKYGIEILVDEMLCVAGIMALGLVTNHITESLVFLLCMIVGAGTMGGVSL